MAFWHPHGVDGHQRPADVEQLQQPRDGRDFVRLGVHRHLAQGQVVVSRPGTDDVQRPQLLGGVAGVAQGLAVDGHVLQTQPLRQRLDPLLEAGEEGLRVEAVEDALEGVMRRDAVGQGEKGLQPFVAAVGKSNNLRPVVGATDDGAEGDHNNVNQEVPAKVPAARVAEPGEVFADGEGGQGHASPP